ncbi:aspartate aminotransferase family protein [Rhizobium mayense]|uniref:Aspartate aminotransferase family protein n=1 Tax=Rhizobium mayense TaxID=1312184 RepID=A0ABT7K3X1_9HYPH|nr:aspartate aminotransferase family protein [Rhizobium mayense]MDL2403297.1 aspartate aminotransferase family protein [Rhizobium mayense]
MPSTSSRATSVTLPGYESNQLFLRSRRVFPDGTTRATVERDPVPRYVLRGDGAHLIDVDGQRFLDLSNNFTTLIHGHGFAPALDAVARLLHDGTCFSNPTVHEIDLAELLVDRIPAIEQIRFVNTGTEAVMFAIKAARAFTGRAGIAKIEGAYHGSYDWAEVGQVGTPATWGPPDAPVAVPSYAGMPTSVADETVILRFNDAEGARRRIAAAADRLSCVLLDLMPSRIGLIPPEADFIAAVVESARHHGILVICDEVLNLRQSYRGASARYGIEPDLIAAGKIIGGGFPIGAIGGSRQVMSVFDGSAGRAKLVQGGTFSANPVSMVAGRVSMEAMTEEVFARLEEMGDRLRAALTAAVERHQAHYVISGAASLFKIHANQTLPHDYREAYPTPEQAASMKSMSEFFRDQGIFLPLGGTACLSTAMTESDIDTIADVFDRYLGTMPR